MWLHVQPSARCVEGVPPELLKVSASFNGERLRSLYASGPLLTQPPVDKAAAAARKQDAIAVLLRAFGWSRVIGDSRRGDRDVVLFAREGEAGDPAQDFAVFDAATGLFLFAGSP